LPSLLMHRLMVDDFKRVFTNLVETWDQQFPRSDAPLAADRQAWELLADLNKCCDAPESGAPNPRRTEGHGDNHLASPLQTC
jgi:hypothetical protein